MAGNDDKQLLGSGVVTELENMLAALTGAL